MNQLFRLFSHGHLTIPSNSIFSYEFHLWKSFLYEMAIWWGPSRYQRRQMPWYCVWGPGIAWAKGALRDCFFYRTE